MGYLLVEHLKEAASLLTAAQDLEDPRLHPQDLVSDLHEWRDSQQAAAQPDLDGPSAAAEAAGQLAQVAELVTKKAHHDTTFEIVTDCFAG